MKLVFVSVAALTLAACASGGNVKGPNGRAFHHIEAVTTASAYKKANDKCPAGYDVVGQRQQGLFHILDIECR